MVVGYKAEDVISLMMFGTSQQEQKEKWIQFSTAETWDH